MLIDFHTHLDWYENKNQLYLELEKFSGIILASSVDLDSYQANLEIESKCQKSNCKIISTFGVHPENAEKYANQLWLLDNALNQSKMIGEIGMDFYWSKNVSKIAQEEVFRYILNHCHKNNKFCVIHTKGAEKEISKILVEYPNAKPIIHWYNGPENIYKDFLERGYFQTFGCETCRNPFLQHLLKITPKNLILAETDNPTAEPWLGGSDISINFIEKIYQDLSNILEISFSALKEQIYENAKGILKSL